ncbi:phage antirepressor KilAC domain-containing protein [Halopseudomonas phragmitis]|nr:phage antirepressor KilAC domain-containing protein [Halopseudomonas phragmitis]
MPNLTLQQAARLLGTGKNRLIKQLKERGILDHQRLPRQADVDAGRFVIDLRTHTGNPLWNQGNGQVYGVTLVTPKGLRWLAQQMGVQITNTDKGAA